jgi:hypothetical protein
MTPKEKAEELVDKYYNLFSVKLENTICVYEAKHCALIAVDEMLSDYWLLDARSRDWWQQVKHELEQL